MAKKLNQYACGWVGCLSSIVHSHGVNTEHVEAWRTIGEPTADDCIKSGLTEYDATAMQKIIEYAE